jgi:hypothetical protein
MPNTCTVCAHEDAVLINEALVIERRSLRNIAKHFDVSYSAVNRHRQHIPQLLVKAAEAEELAQADSLMDQIKTMIRRNTAFIDKAEEAEDGFEFRAHVAEWRRQIELLAKIAGELDERPVINLNLSPEWLELRAVIVGALEPYADAHAAVVRAIAKAGNGGGPR